MCHRFNRITPEWLPLLTRGIASALACLATVRGATLRRPGVETVADDARHCGGHRRLLMATDKRQHRMDYHWAGSRVGAQSKRLGWRSRSRQLHLRLDWILLGLELFYQLGKFARRWLSHLLFVNIVRKYECADRGRDVDAGSKPRGRGRGHQSSAGAAHGGHRVSHQQHHDWNTLGIV